MSNPKYDPARSIPLNPAEPVDKPRRYAWQVTGDRVTYWICTDEITEAVVHFVAPRTLGCAVVHGKGDCPYCKAGLNRRKTWWLQASVEAGTAAQVELLELTLNALNTEPHLVTGNGYLWGRRLTVWRYPGGPKDPMYAELDTSSTPKDLPKVEPTLQILIRRWQARTSAAVLRRMRSSADGKSLGGTAAEGGDNGH